MLSDEKINTNFKLDITIKGNKKDDKKQGQQFSNQNQNTNYCDLRLLNFLPRKSLPCEAAATAVIRYERTLCQV